MAPDLLWTLIAFFLTILVLSYVLGDNGLFRFIMMIFVGISAGYAAVLIYYQVLLPRLIIPLLTAPAAEKAIFVIPGVLGILLLFKLSPRLSALGNPSMALLTGVGAAVAIGGAVTGTLFGQISGAISPFDLAGVQAGGNWFTQLLGGIVLLGGTVCSLAYFHFGARKKDSETTGSQPALIQILARIGQVFIAITLGALFAGVLSAALAALIERLAFLINVIKSLIV
ncbi:hypothetical protein EG834_20475 [bacterium]|nr:hypothetical protein [bacterium]